MIGLYKFIQPECKKVHKRNYFIFVLMIADKAHKLQEFKKLYTYKVKAESYIYK